MSTFDDTHVDLEFVEGSKDGANAAVLAILGVRPREPPHCGSGGIGRRAGLRSLWDLVPWGFKSPLPHQLLAGRLV